MNRRKTFKNMNIKNESLLNYLMKIILDKKVEKIQKHRYIMHG